MLMDAQDLLNHCPELFDDETLYSWVSRWVYDSPYHSIAACIEILIGSKNKKLDSMFPSFISRLADISNIKSEELINKHTIIPYFQSFCEKGLFQTVLNDIYEGDTKSVCPKLSTISGHVYDNKTHNYCPKCVESDVEKYGIAYWHVQHQLPGVSACIRHEQQLKEINRCRRTLIKPPQVVSNESFKPVGSKALKLAKFSSELLTKDISHLDGKELSSIYRYKLLEIGIGSLSQIPKQKEAHQVFKKYWKSILHVDEINLIFTLGKTNPYPACLFIHAKSHHCPLKHLLMIGMLFESLDEFVVFGEKIK
jgi:hypothetical protein